MPEIRKVFSRRPSQEQQGEKSPTTDREKEIVQLVVQGCRNCDIAKRLSIDELTVNEDMDRIFDKLAVSNRFELTLYAVHRQLVKQSETRLPEERRSSFSLPCRMRDTWLTFLRRLRKV
jgi:two-component system, NarL family, competent response regulator ComA